MELLKSKYNLIGTSIFVLAILLSHIFATNNYNWTRNTISDLGAQQYERRYIMQAGFLLFGLTIIVGILLNGIKLRTAPVLVYGICVGLTGVFCTKPFFYANNYSVSQASIHSVLAQIAGGMFTLGIIAQLFYSTDKSEKWVHVVFLILVIGFSASFGLAKNYQGVVQRLLYVVSFIWLTKFYTP